MTLLTLGKRVKTEPILSINLIFGVNMKRLK